MRKLLVALGGLFLCLSAQAQNFAFGSLTASGADCTTAGACITLQFEGNDVASASIQLSGTFTATVQFEASSDKGTTWVAISGVPLNSSAAVTSATTANTWKFNVASITNIRARASAWTSAPTVIIRSSRGDPASVGGGSTGTGAQPVQGAGASGATTVGNPLLSGCAFETSPTTVSSGQTNNVHCDSSGRQIVVGGITSGTASAITQGGMPMLCDSATSGTVTAGQAQMVRCNTAGVPALVVANQNNDVVSSSSEGGVVLQSGATTTLQTTGKLYTGAAYARIYAANLANMPTSQTLTARNEIGTQLIEKGSRWMVISNPAAGSQATASIASEASVRHIVDCVSFSAAATAAPAATALTINVRDGATGAGTIIWTYQVVVTAATGQLVAPHSICGLNLVGTTATAMTLEFSASLANLIESVSISGYNVN